MQSEYPIRKIMVAFFFFFIDTKDINALLELAQKEKVSHYALQTNNKSSHIIADTNTRVGGLDTRQNNQKEGKRSRPVIHSKYIMNLSLIIK